MQGESFWNAAKVTARLSHATAWNQLEWVDLAQPFLPFLSSPEETCNNNRKRNKAVGFIIFLFVTNLLLFDLQKQIGSFPSSDRSHFCLRSSSGAGSGGCCPWLLKPRWRSARLLSDRKAKKKWHLLLKRETVGLSPVEDGRSPAAVVRGSCCCRLLREKKTLLMTLLFGFCGGERERLG